MKLTKFEKGVLKIIQEYHPIVRTGDKCKIVKI